MNVFEKAEAGVWLSPATRAGLKVIQGIIVSAVLTTYLTIYPMVASGKVQEIDWNQVLQTGVTSFLATFLLAVWKFVTAKNAATTDNPVSGGATGNAPESAT